MSVSAPSVTLKISIEQNRFFLKLYLKIVLQMLRMLMAFVASKRMQVMITSQVIHTETITTTTVMVTTMAPTIIVKNLNNFASAIKKSRLPSINYTRLIVKNSQTCISTLVLEK